MPGQLFPHRAALAALSRRRAIRRLSPFGSVLKGGARGGEGIVAIRSPTPSCGRDAEDDLSPEDIPNRKANRCSSR
jgi:hypothetical protein